MQFIKDFFITLNDLFLKMTWLSDLVDWFLLKVIGLEESGMLFTSLSFFIYDVIKIFILLAVLIFIASYVQSYFTAEKTRKLLMKKSGLGANTLGALLGTVTPFCSCSSIPIFIGFTKAGLPLGVTFSFLISSPLVDLASVLMLASIFNWQIALSYVVVGLIIAVVGGFIISKMHMEDQVADFIKASCETGSCDAPLEEELTKKQRVDYAKDQVKTIIKRVWIYVLIGVGIGALIHGVIPQAWILSILGNNNPFSVLIATLIGVPMYADIFGTLPVAEALVFAGVGIGTVLAFMMAVTALSLPSMIMIKKVIKTKLFITFVSIVIVGIILVGYVFNGLSYLFI
ncbi:MAG: permease [Tenericutes bacterium GWC2_34_14]|nr:MAG: permease [Tenericutes bacterium GWA2_35_7]OHE28446.1 MAG: permease [Tenericutes bacterium GWC2_34_14]OHE33646.1 MAG: permease [Tenericutes bacterium GWE2_34_108]OHE36931.1 MAG: permease [Tenericutes bacterium GWF1_35_14]OHE37989.1 MAG: permease [Tenericutes bacterium GWF2_35_184]OHE42058.1 MAG: permease [Tenericutes bacterium RIFOXYA12_FULL_35_10]OHE43494.1 MAG: permease [Tenericutes bacterium RIFOXYA2_FULL_36_32]OHE46588.1 MAG: permease [Tenericutes bacterium RIFOXYB2_FULL_36_25]OH